MDAIDIFRAGTHTAMNGATLDFSEADLDAMVRAYDPARHEAPIVVGHPARDAPAYGWVRSLARSGALLQATPDQVDPKFAELVSAGRFKKISASFYPPGAANNPVPETYYLRHVGVLGAQPPAVKGLRDAQFADDEDGVLTLEFGEDEDAAEPLLRRLRDLFAGELRRVLPDSSASLDHSEPSMTNTPTAGPSPDDLAARSAELDTRQSEIDAREQRLQAAEAASQRRVFADFAEKLVSEGRLLPRDKTGLVAFMSTQSGDAVLEFGEGNDAWKGASLDWFKQFLGALPVQVDFGERGGDGCEPPAVRLAIPEHHAADPERLDLHNKALAYQEAHAGASYADAVLTVSQGG